MKLMKITLPVVALMLGSFTAQANTAEGKILQEKHCTKCHDSSIYTRANRQVRSLGALQQRVKGCEVPAGVKWSESQLNAVINYLNTEFYHFK